MFRNEEEQPDLIVKKSGTYRRMIFVK